MRSHIRWRSRSESTGVSTWLLLSRLIVASIFLLAAVDKLQAPGAFAAAVRAYHVLPDDLANTFAFFLPWLELLAGLYLLLGFLTRTGAAMIILMLGMFVVVLTRALIIGDTNHACGCFTQGGGVSPILAFLEGGNTITWWDPARDVILAALAAANLWLGAGRFSVEGFLASRPSASGRMQESDA